MYPVLHVNLYADIGGPDAFPPSVWNTLARPDAEQRIRRLLALPGQPDLHSAARELGIRHAILASQVRQLEATTGTTLLRIAPGTPITLTPEGEQFAREALTALNMLRVTTSAGTE